MDYFNILALEKESTVGFKCKEYRRSAFVSFMDSALLICRWRRSGRICELMKSSAYGHTLREDGRVERSVYDRVETMSTVGTPVDAVFKVWRTWA